MARSDYAHWNEDADAIWWEEEGRHGSEGPPFCDLCMGYHEGPCQEDQDPDEWEDDDGEDE